ncbi:MAG: DUF1549 domain-containing protein [Pirellulaceae bacterium]
MGSLLFDLNQGNVMDMRVMGTKAFNTLWGFSVGAIVFASVLYLSPQFLRSQDTATKNRIEKIDELVAKVWEAYQLQPSDPADDGEWCRRLYLDLIGRIPKVNELEAFLNDESPNKKEQLVERLLYGDEYTEEFARNWTTVWTNLLIGRTGGNANNSLISREGMQKFLRDAFAREMPYDRFVRELITANGNTRPDGDDFNGATNFLIDKVNMDNGAQATAATSQLFLGLQVQCTQCHNHPFNDWKQQKYWEFNAFFRQTRAFRGQTDADSPILADQDYGGESGNVDEADLFFELRNGLLKVAYPVFVDGEEIERSGYVNVVNRREKLADFIVNSEYMPKVMANRMWGYFLGYGFTKPVDDLGPHNIPSNPELLDYLSTEFRDSGFDVRSLMKWIVLSRPYSLSSKITRYNESDDPLSGQPPRFTHFYIRQMTAEQLYESMLVAQGDTAEQYSFEVQEQRRNRWLQQFASTFGNDEGTESSTFNGTIPQVLMMFNGDMIQAATTKDSGSIIAQAMQSGRNKGNQAVNFLYRAGLAREANRDELRVAEQFLGARGGDASEAMVDIWWMILNSNEFIFVH